MKKTIFILLSFLILFSCKENISNEDGTNPDGTDYTNPDGTDGANPDDKNKKKIDTDYKKLGDNCDLALYDNDLKLTYLDYELIYHQNTKDLCLAINDVRYHAIFLDGNIEHVVDEDGKDTNREYLGVWDIVDNKMIIDSNYLTNDPFIDDGELILTAQSYKVSSKGFADLDKLKVAIGDIYHDFQFKPIYYPNKPIGSPFFIDLKSTRECKINYKIIEANNDYNFLYSDEVKDNCEEVNFNDKRYHIIIDTNLIGKSIVQYYMGDYLGIWDAVDKKFISDFNNEDKNNEIEPINFIMNPFKDDGEFSDFDNNEIYVYSIGFDTFDEAKTNFQDLFKDNLMFSLLNGGVTGSVINVLKINKDGSIWLKLEKK